MDASSAIWNSLDRARLEAYSLVTLSLVVTGRISLAPKFSSVEHPSLIIASCPPYSSVVTGRMGANSEFHDKS
jgi:hypothetical protein